MPKKPLDLDSVSYNGKVLTEADIDKMVSDGPKHPRTVGRPPRVNTASKGVTIRFSPSEISHIDELARVLDLSRSDVVRQVLAQVKVEDVKI